ncbi:MULTISPECIES: phosphoglycerate mutase family protein [unclassified Pseudomonas]|uniref:phosphoglycerate mutase family protein n=1 Tax=unclassified Pseudomonas TaxID=196821 RepID=UPI0019140C24|nr:MULTISPECIES: histidine phosphatase family protein [unclassified Pseudomonas]MBK5553020.1 histidine phosphatase family protein [Pseudomonas sp. TH03]MEB0225221.1 histidine phosphatase family protein [Pseudomonas sp. 5S1]MEB0298605.1 histidine phosphatase family protein [Pseudomonas sp. 10S4]WPX16987.1 histidine phosphatase family protein [Pseudomonas sp. 10S4]
MIYLIRHASPLVNYERCNSASAKVLLDEYNQTSRIDEDEITGFLNQPDLSQPLLASEASVFSSPVNRAYATACRLFEVARIQQDSRLQEYDLRLSAIPFLKMGLRQWFALHRILWLLGVSLGAVSRKAEYLRAVGVAEELYKSSAEAGKTMIVISHGMFLRTVRKTLQKQGMQARTIYRSGCFTVESLTP